MCNKNSAASLNCPAFQLITLICLSRGNNVESNRCKECPKCTLWLIYAEGLLFLQELPLPIILLGLGVARHLLNRWSSFIRNRLCHENNTTSVNQMGRHCFFSHHQWNYFNFPSTSLIDNYKSVHHCWLAIKIRRVMKARPGWIRFTITCLLVIVVVVVVGGNKNSGLWIDFQE